MEEVGGSAYSELVGKTEGKRQLEISQPRWEDNIKVELKEIVWEDVDRIYLAQDTN
jgi:hypothetical protein